MDIIMTHEIEKLLGKTLETVKVIDDEEIIFTTDTNEVYRMYHCQDCCESVYVDDIIGDLDDLTYSPILEAREATNRGRVDESFWAEYYNPEDFVLQKMAGFPDLERNRDESETWTFYILTTNKGSVTIRWYGTSSGYYSESVDFERVE